MPIEKITSSAEDAIEAAGRKEAIIARAQGFRESENFQKLASQDQQTFENYWTLVNGGLDESSGSFNYELSNFESFMNQVGA